MPQPTAVPARRETSHALSHSDLPGVELPSIDGPAVLEGRLVVHNGDEAVEAAQRQVVHRCPYAPTTRLIGLRRAVTG